MKTLWSVIEALVELNQKSIVSDFNKILNVPFIKSESSNEYFTFYDNLESIKFDEMVFSNATIAVKNTRLNITSISVKYMKGSCITKEQLKDRYGELMLVGAPGSPAPNATTVWRVQINGRKVSFGFPNKSPNCLADFSISYAFK